MILKEDEIYPIGKLFERYNKAHSQERHLVLKEIEKAQIHNQGVYEKMRQRLNPLTQKCGKVGECNKRVGEYCEHPLFCSAKILVDSGSNSSYSSENEARRDR